MYSRFQLLKTFVAFTIKPLKYICRTNIAMYRPATDATKVFQNFDEDSKVCDSKKVQNQYGDLAGTKNRKGRQKNQQYTPNPRNPRRY